MIKFSLLCNIFLSVGLPSLYGDCFYYYFTGVGQVIPGAPYGGGYPQQQYPGTSCSFLCMTVSFYLYTYLCSVRNGTVCGTLRGVVDVQ